MTPKLIATGIAALMITTSPLAVPNSTPVFAQDAAASEQQESKATLAELTAQSERLMAALIRASRLSEEDALGLKSETGKPYWAALRALNTAIGKMTNGAALQDDTFHEGLSETVREGTAVIASYELSGAEDARVEKVLKALEENVTVLYDAFSKAADRARKGDELTDAEQERLAKAKEQQAELQKRLDAIEEKVRDNKRALEGLKEVRKKSREISNSGSTVGDFLAAMIALRILDGLIWGCHPWWGIWGGWYPGFSVVIVDIYDGYYDGFAYDWDYYGDVAIDYDLAALDDADLIVDDAEMMDSLDFIEEADIGFDGELAEPLLDGLDAPTEEDFANEDLGLEETMLDDEPVVEPMVEDPADDVAIDEVIEEDVPLEEAEPLIEEVAPVVEEAAPVIEEAVPMDLGEADEGFDSFDSFEGGGFDDIGGFDDW